MRIENLSIVNFKNFESYELEFSEKFNCFLGNNGAGKTNLMDALYYLSFTKSHFNPVDRQNIRHGEAFFVIQGKYKLNGQEEKISCGVKKDKKKSFRRNGKEVSRLSDHIGLLPLVFITPSDTNIIHLGSELRRKFMDGVISQYDKNYLKELLIYNRALEQRNALLKDMEKKRSWDSDSLDVWDNRLIPSGNYIHEKRKEFTKALIPIFNRYYREISGEAETVSLSYKSRLFDSSFEQLLSENHDRDRILKHTSVGPHRDDLVLMLNEHPIRKTGSQGQQKTLIIALKLAEFDFISQTIGIRPVLLLDDIFDKLDRQRVAHLVNLLSKDSYGQVFFTDTSPDRLPDILQQIKAPYRIFTIETHAYES